jgi:hypothetical protein
MENGLKKNAEGHMMDWQDEETAILFAQDGPYTGRWDPYTGGLAKVAEEEVGVAQQRTWCLQGRSYGDEQRYPGEAGRCLLRTITWWQY